MGCNEKIEQQKQADLFDDLKSIELTPLPYFTHELLSLPEDIMTFLRNEADRHNCTVSYIISHFMEDVLSVTKDISEISQEMILDISKEKPYLFIKKDGKPFARISFFGEYDKMEQKFSDTR